MRVAIVPAQITTVEDMLIGKLSVKQGMLLGVPILSGFLLAIIFPPSGQFVLYKTVIALTVLAICGTLALRIKGKIIIEWLILFVVYIARPKYFVFDKNSTYLRPKWQKPPTTETQAEAQQGAQKPLRQPIALQPKELHRLQEFADKNKGNISYFVGKNGELNVRITEIE